MNQGKKTGIWMDHANAHIMEYSEEPVESKRIKSEFTHDAKEESLSKSEIGMHHKEQHLQTEFYKNIGEEIKKYEEVILFGPTNAKAELFNILKADHLFAKINIEILQSEYMTENQQWAFVKAHFSKS